MFEQLTEALLDSTERLLRNEIRQIPDGEYTGGATVNMDGSEGPRAQSTRAFARNLSQLTELPIALWDERLSTAAVERALIAADASRSKRKAIIDQHAAAYILQGALDRLSRKA